MTKPPDLKSIMRLLQVSQESLARMLNVSSRTVHRWLDRTQPPYDQRLQRLQRTVELLGDSLKPEAAIREYLNHPNPSLGEETPLTFLRRGDFDQVEADLQSLREGVYL